MIVVDASVALRWFLNEAGGDDARQCFQQSDVIAPDFALAEIANGVWSAYRRGRADLETAKALVALSLRIYDDVRPQAELQERSFEIACDLDHPIYDCAYLALADLRRCPFLTLDLRLQAKANGTRWQDVISLLTP